MLNVVMGQIQYIPVCRLYRAVMCFRQWRTIEALQANLALKYQSLPWETNTTARNRDTVSTEMSEILSVHLQKHKETSSFTHTLICCLDAILCSLTTDLSLSNTPGGGEEADETHTHTHTHTHTLILVHISSIVLRCSTSDLPAPIMFQNYLPCDHVISVCVCVCVYVCVWFLGPSTASIVTLHMFQCLSGKERDCTESGCLTPVCLSVCLSDMKCTSSNFTKTGVLTWKWHDKTAKYTRKHKQDK